MPGREVAAAIGIQYRADHPPVAAALRRQKEVGSMMCDTDTVLPRLDHDAGCRNFTDKADTTIGEYTMHLDAAVRASLPGKSTPIRQEDGFTNVSCQRIPEKNSSQVLIFLIGNASKQSLESSRSLKSARRENPVNTPCRLDISKIALVSTNRVTSPSHQSGLFQ